LIREGGRFWKEGLTPLLDTPKRGYFQARIGKEGASPLLSVPELLTQGQDSDKRRERGADTLSGFPFTMRYQRW